MKRQLLIVFAALAAAPLAAETAKFLPPKEQVLLIVGQDIPSIEGYMDAVGIQPGGLAAYTGIEMADGLAEPVDHGGGLQHADKLLHRYPESVIQLALYMVDSLEKINGGDLDPKIDALAAWLKTADRPVFLRIGYEFDYPDNHYEPEAYIKAFRRIVDKLRAAEVDNVAYVWHSYADKLERPHMAWYPGDGYVDWFAISYFDQPPDQMEKIARLARERGKPLMIAEASPWKVAPATNPKAWKEWFEPFFAFVRRNNVRAVSYINCDWDAVPIFAEKAWGDCRVQASDAVKDAWIDETADDRYLKAAPDLFERLGHRRKVTP